MPHGKGRDGKGGQDGDQRAESQFALDHEIAADRIEEERSQLPQEIVQELDEELAPVDVEPDVVDFAEPGRDMRLFEMRRVVEMDVGYAGDAFAELVRQVADGLDAPLGQLVHLRLELGNQVELRRIEGNGGKSEQEVLVENEQQIGQEQAALEGGQGEGIADESPERLGLRGNHGQQLRLGDLLEPVIRESQHAAEEIVPKASEHSLSDHAPVHVVQVLETPGDQDQQQEREAQDQQIADLVHRHAQQGFGNVAAVDGAVDDDFRHLQRSIDHRHGDQSDQENENLVAGGMLEDEAIDRRLYPVPVFFQEDAK